jgi:AbrB family looped-hinge helix DNA binding protein
MGAYRAHKDTGGIQVGVPIDRDTVGGMETVTISPEFQVVIPHKIREAMGLRSEEKAKVVAFRSRIEIIPMREVRSLRGYLKGIDTSFVRDDDRL